MQFTVNEHFILQSGTEFSKNENASYFSLLLHMYTVNVKHLTWI